MCVVLGSQSELCVRYGDLTRCTLKIKIIFFVLHYIMCDNFPIVSVAG